MSGFGFSDGDDVIIKGDDGSDDGVKIKAVEDQEALGTYRLGVDAQVTTKISDEDLTNAFLIEPQYLEDILKELKKINTYFALITNTKI